MRLEGWLITSGAASSAVLFCGHHSCSRKTGLLYPQAAPTAETVAVTSNPLRTWQSPQPGLQGHIDWMPPISLTAEGPELVSVVDCVNGSVNGLPVSRPFASDIPHSPRVSIQMCDLLWSMGQK